MYIICGVMCCILLHGTCVHQHVHGKPRRVAERRSARTPPGTNPPGDSKPAANVRYVKGMVLANGQPHNLHYNDPLQAGWVLSFKNGHKDDRLEFSYQNGDYVCLTADSRPYRVHSLNPDSLPVAKVWVPAGRKQGRDVEVFSPPHEGGVVWPARFTFRWKPLPVKAYFLLRRHPRKPPVLLDDTPLLCTSPQIEAGKGEYASQEARDALRKLRTEDPDMQVELTLVTPDSNGLQVVFGLLSEQEESRLKSELDGMEKVEEPQRSIQRSDAFLRRRLYTEAADEIENALAAVPDSVGLRFAAIWAHRLSGNREREEYQIGRLPRGTKLPGD